MPTAITFRKWMDTGYSLGAALLLWIGLQANCLATPPVSGPLVGTWRLISYTPPQLTWDYSGRWRGAIDLPRNWALRRTSLNPEFAGP